MSVITHGCACHICVSARANLHAHTDTVYLTAYLYAHTGGRTHAASHAQKHTMGYYRQVDGNHDGQGSLKVLAVAFHPLNQCAEMIALREGAVNAEDVCQQMRGGSNSQNRAWQVHRFSRRRVHDAIRLQTTVLARLCCTNESIAFQSCRSARRQQHATRLCRYLGLQ